VAIDKPKKMQPLSTPREKVMGLAEALDELIVLRLRLERKESEAGFGLVWEDIQENVEGLLVAEVPVLASVSTLDVKGGKPYEAPHVLIEGDNLHALHTLQATNRDTVDVIYIDPPYNTGKEFIYNDKLVDAESTFRHSAWLSFMSKRLRLAHSLLAPSGLIFISIDDNEQANLKLLCDEVFGVLNFVTCAPTIMNLKGNQDQFAFAGTHEYTLVYAKDKTQSIVGQFEVDEEAMLDEWETDEYGWWKRGAGLKATGVNAPRSKRPNLWYPLYVAKDSTYVSPVRQKSTDVEIWPKTSGNEMSWRWSSTTADERSYDLIAVGTYPNFTIYKKQRPGLGDLPSKKPKSTLYKPEYSTTNGTNTLKKILGDRSFPNPKPVDLIKDLVSLCALRDDAVVLDFFAGSGTTLQAVAELNAEDGKHRRCILVTNNENNICREVTQPRIAAILSGKWADGKHEALPGSLAFYKTDFIVRRKNLDRMRSDIARHTVDLVAIKEGAQRKGLTGTDFTMLTGPAKSIAVVTSLYPDHAAVHEAATSAARADDAKSAYLFTWSDQGIEAELVEQWEGWNVQPLPAEMLAALRRLAPTQSLFDEASTGEEG
jgi:adenine-specific DNA-methyltransferase